MSAVAHAREVRARLMNPTNAKPDDGIDLKRKLMPEPAPQIVQEIAPPIAADATTPEQIRARMEELNRELDRLHEQHARLTGRRNPSVREIQKAIAKYYRVPMNELLSVRRDAHYVKARQVGMYLCRELTLLSLPSIGRQFGGRDHTTILHGYRKIAGLLPNDPGLQQDIENLSAMFPA